MAKAYPVEVIRNQFDAAIARVKRYSWQGAKKIITDAAEMFLQSAARATPPNKGSATISKEKYERSVIQLDRITKGGHETTHYYVPYRTARKQGRKYWITEQAAKAFARIQWRGLGKLGWDLGLPKIGRNLTAAARTLMRMSPKAAAKNPAEVKITGSGSNYSIELTNNSEGIDRYAAMSVPEGMIKARNRMNAAAKQYELDLGKLFK